MALSFGAQLEFARAFAKYSGMSGNVILAWCLQEQPPGSPAKPGSNNWLNIGYTDAGPNGEYAAIEGKDPDEAARASVVWMNINQPSIGATKGKSEYDQASAIVNSGWASSHYGGVAKFYGVVQQVSGSKLERTAPAPQHAAATMRVATGGDPVDRSHKIYVTGKGLGGTGTQFSGHTIAMRNLRKRHTAIKIK